MPSIMDRIAQIRRSLNGSFSKDDCNLVQHDNADVSDIIEKSGIGKKKYRIATAGYSYEQEGYKEATFKFLKYLDTFLKPWNTAYITPPSLYPGSIYDITTSVSGLKSNNVAFFTTQRYWENTDLSAFSKDINRRRFLKAPIHIFPDNQTYLEATANASNVLICTGGRKVSINEIVEALKRNHNVIMLVNRNLKNGDFDQKNNTVECAPRYFHNYIVNCGEDPANIKDVDLKFLRENEGKILQLVKWYFVDDDESIKSAAYRASKVITSPNIFEIIEKNTCMDHKEKERVAKTFSTQVGEAYLRGKSTQL